MSTEFILELLFSGFADIMSSRNPKELQVRLQATVDALRVQSQLPRKPLSQTLMDLINDCQANHANDPLLNPPRAEQNPFREKSRCTVL